MAFIGIARALPHSYASILDKDKAGPPAVSASEEMQPAMQTVRVGRVDEFDDPGRKVIAVSDTEIGVFRLDGAFYAWVNECPHQGGPVCQGRLFRRVLEVLDEDQSSHGRTWDDETLHIVCPWHGFEYDVRTGKHPGMPDIALTPVPVQVQNGEVHILVD